MAWITTRLPRGDEQSPAVDAPLATAHWLPQAAIRAGLGFGEAFPTGRSPLILGLSEENGKRSIIAHDDDRHAVLVVGSRGGKSVSFIIPNLLSYPGSVVVTDPKGELALMTAAHRRDRLGQNVVVLDPFNVLALYGKA